MKRAPYRLIVACLLVVLSIGLLPPISTSAANINGTSGVFDVAVSPTSEDLEVNPGSSLSTTIQLRNEGTSTENLKVLLYTFTAEGISGTPVLLPFTSNNDESKNWVTFSTTEIAAQPGVWTPVTVTISPPKTAAFGYYYAVLFQRDSENSGGSGVINQVGAVASLILLDVNAPGAVKRASIDLFSTTHHVSEFLPVSFTIRMHNTGNVHVAPRGNIFITKGGKTIATLNINEAEGNVLPKTYRLFTTEWTDGTPVYKEKLNGSGSPVLDSNGVPVTYLDWSNFNLSKLRFGKYDARLDMVYNNGENDVEDTAYLSFWAIPWRIIIFVVVVILFIIAGVWALFIRPLRKRTSKGRGWSVNKS